MALHLLYYCFRIHPNCCQITDEIHTVKSTALNLILRGYLFRLKIIVDDFVRET